MLVFFFVQADPAAVRNLAFEQILWAKPEDLLAMDFLPARIASWSLSWPAAFCVSDEQVSDESS